MIDRDSTSIDLEVSGSINSARYATASSSSSSEPTMDTLDEPVQETLMRDLRNIQRKLYLVLFPSSKTTDILRDWDLWGPLLLCLTLALTLSISAPENQATIVFTGVFFIIWVGSGVVTLNSKLLGGNISVFQSVCVLGYCIFPLTLAAVLGTVIRLLVMRLFFVAPAFGWSVYASLGFLGEGKLAKKRWLAVYPVFLFYFIVAWLIIIS